MHVTAPRLVGLWRLIWAGRTALLMSTFLLLVPHRFIDLGRWICTNLLPLRWQSHVAFNISGLARSLTLGSCEDLRPKPRTQAGGKRFWDWGLWIGILHCLEPGSRVHCRVANVCVWRIEITRNIIPIYNYIIYIYVISDMIWHDIKFTLHKSQSSNCELFYFHHDYIEVFDKVLLGPTQPAKIWYPPHPSCGLCVCWCSGAVV